MENKRSERDNYVRHGLIVACIVCIIGVCFEMSKVALMGAILLCFVQLVDLIWYVIEIKFKDCKNIKQAFCKCQDIEILNEWDGVDTKFGKCPKCGKYFMINEKINAIAHISEEEYKTHVEVFDAIEKSKENIEKTLESLNFDEVLNALENTFGDNVEEKKENKE